MRDVADRADSGTVTSSAGGENDRGAAIRQRIDALGISDREWHATTGIDRKTLHRAIRNEPGTRAGTYLAIESALDKLEAAIAGQPVARPAESTPRVVRIEVPNVYGAQAIIVEGPVDDLPALEAAVDRIMRRLAADQKDTE